MMGSASALSWYHANNLKMDLGIGVSKRPLRVTNALKILEVMEVYDIKLLSPHSRTLAS
jgi:hypothetical protein